MEEKTKIATKTWFECADCHTKMETVKISGSGGIFDDFLGGSTKSCFYCNDKNCPKFGYLTVAGIKKEE